ncbi:MAG: hypothetical protein MUF87_18640 [Anaerolineae bacterium]|nr:hypothetical protein [Anaerolineae bacterium]
MYGFSTRLQLILAWDSAYHVVHDTRILAPFRFKIGGYVQQTAGAISY